jgi:hypothetical protein
MLSDHVEEFEVKEVVIVLGTSDHFAILEEDDGWDSLDFEDWVDLVEVAWLPALTFLNDAIQKFPCGVLEDVLLDVRFGTYAITAP